MLTPNPFHAKQWLAGILALFTIILIAHLSIISSFKEQFSVKNFTTTNAFSTRLIEPTPVDLPAPFPPPSVAPPPAPTPAPPKAKLATLKPVRKPTTQTSESAHADESLPLLPAPDQPPSPSSDEASLSPTSAANTNLTTAFNAAPAEAAPTPTPTPSNRPISHPTSSTFSDDTPPTPFTAPSTVKHSYKVVFTKNGNSNTGKAELNWQQDGSKYVLTLNASYFGFAVFSQSSVGEISAQGIQPNRFTDKRANRSEVAAHFNHDLKKISFSANTPDMPLQAGAQDRASVILQIAGMLAAAPNLNTQSSALRMQTVSATEAETWLFSMNPDTTLNLPSGVTSVVQVTRKPRREFDQTVEIWYAPSQNYAPVRFRFTEKNGDFIDAQLQN